MFLWLITCLMSFLFLLYVDIITISLYIVKPSKIYSAYFDKAASPNKLTCNWEVLLIHFGQWDNRSAPKGCPIWGNPSKNSYPSGIIHYVEKIPALSVRFKIPMKGYNEYTKPRIKYPHILLSPLLTFYSGLNLFFIVSLICNSQ